MLYWCFELGMFVLKDIFMSFNVCRVILVMGFIDCFCIGCKKIVYGILEYWFKRSNFIINGKFWFISYF